MDVLSHIPWESTQMENVGSLIVKTILQSKMGSAVDFPEENFPENVLLKSMTVDTMPKLTQKDCVKEQMEDVDIDMLPNESVHELHALYGPIRPTRWVKYAFGIIF